MGKKENSIFRHLWLTTPGIVVFLYIITASYVHIPLGRLSVNEATQLLRHREKKREASLFPQKEARLRSEIAMLDSVLRRIEERSQRQRRTLIDELYNYADSSGFTTGKVEIGIPQKVAGRRETAVAIKGSGTYRATGAFVERIENCAQSTRIRQLLLKGGGEGALDVFIDLAVREEDGAVKGDAGR